MNSFFKYFSVLLFLSCAGHAVVREEVVPKKIYDELLEKYQKLQMQISRKREESVVVPTLTPKTEVLVGAEEEFLTKIEEAKAHIDKGSYDAALGILQPLTQVSIPQIVVQARFLMGEMLYLQKEYDLAMQIYEEIIRENAHSGIVINVLERLVDCCDQLNLTQKREQYKSLLNDVFNKE